MAEARQQQKTKSEEHRQHERRMYLTFAAMIATSTVTMFLLTYTNAFAWSHMTFSEERVYMALLMGSVMAIIMLGFMWSMMYKNRKVNIAIIAAALIVGGAALWLSRSQALVQDESYMKGMIPHHSIAILTSERSEIEDLRVPSWPTRSSSSAHRDRRDEVADRGHREERCRHHRGRGQAAPRPGLRGKPLSTGPVHSQPASGDDLSARGESCTQGLS
jgi:hypothetical protein